MYSFKKYNPLLFRIWHWANAFLILGLLGTVLLRKTFLSWRTNSALIQTKLAENGLTISSDLSKEIATSIRAPMWDWHYIFGFSLIGFMVLRLVYQFLQKDRVRLIDRIKGLRSVTAAEKNKALHVTLVQSSYVLFYFVVSFMMTSGVTLYFKKELALPKEFAGTLKETHELSMWFFVVFTAAHILGVIMSELRGDKGLVSDMINGGETKD